jgi:hypothetical protein
VTGSAILQGEEGAQPFELGLGKGLPVSEGVVVGEHRAKGGHKDDVDAVHHAALHPPVRKLGESSSQVLDGGSLV